MGNFILPKRKSKIPLGLINVGLILLFARRIPILPSCAERGKRAFLPRVRAPRRIFFCFSNPWWDWIRLLHGLELPNWKFPPHAFLPSWAFPLAAGKENSSIRPIASCCWFLSWQLSEYLSKRQKRTYLMMWKGTSGYSKFRNFLNSLP